jgi:hypothetical protein
MSVSSDSVERPATRPISPAAAALSCEMKRSETMMARAMRRMLRAIDGASVSEARRIHYS